MGSYNLRQVSVGRPHWSWEPWIFRILSLSYLWKWSLHLSRNVYTSLPPKILPSPLLNEEINPSLSVKLECHFLKEMPGKTLLIMSPKATNVSFKPITILKASRGEIKRIVHGKVHYTLKTLMSLAMHSRRNLVTMCENVFSGYGIMVGRTWNWVSLSLLIWVHCVEIIG